MRPALPAAALTLLLALPAQQRAPKHDGPAFLPVGLGASWHYRVLDNGRAHPQLLRMTVARRTESPGGPLYVVQVTHAHEEGARTLRVDRAGIEEVRAYRSRHGGPDRNWALRILACPPGPILEWASDAPDEYAAAGFTASGRVVDLAEEVAVPAGRFRAVTVEVEMARNGDVYQRTRTSYVREVGIVRETVEWWSGGALRSKRTLELTRARPALGGKDGFTVSLVHRVDADAIASPLLEGWPRLSLVRERVDAEHVLLRETRQGVVPFVPDSEADWNEYMKDVGVHCTHADRMFAEDLVAAIATTHAAATMPPQGVHLVPRGPVLTVPSHLPELTAEGNYEVRNEEGASLRQFRVELRIEGSSVAYIRIRGD